MNASFLAVMFGGPELLMVVFALVLLFGAKKIPELMKGLGQGIKEFKSASKEEENESLPENSTKSSSADKE